MTLEEVVVVLVLESGSTATSSAWGLRAMFNAVRSFGRLDCMVLFYEDICCECLIYNTGRPLVDGRLSTFARSSLSVPVSRFFVICASERQCGSSVAMGPIVADVESREDLDKLVRESDRVILRCFYPTHAQDERDVVTTTNKSAAARLTASFVESLPDELVCCRLDLSCHADIAAGLGLGFSGEEGSESTDAASSGTMGACWVFFRAGKQVREKSVKCSLLSFGDCPASTWVAYLVGRAITNSDAMTPAKRRVSFG